MGTTSYYLGIPRFPKATVKLGSKELRVVIAGSPEGTRVRQVSFNGNALPGYTIEHAALVGGGELVFELE